MVGFIRRIVHRHGHRRSADDTSAILLMLGDELGDLFLRELLGAAQSSYYSYPDLLRWARLFLGLSRELGESPNTDRMLVLIRELGSVGPGMGVDPMVPLYYALEHYQW